MTDGRDILLGLVEVGLRQGLAHGVSAVERALGKGTGRLLIDQHRQLLEEELVGWVMRWARDQMMGRLTVTVDGKGGIVIRHHDGQPKP